MYLFMHKYILIYISHLAVPKIRVNLCPFVVSETEPKSTALFRINCFMEKSHTNCCFVLELR
jgi:hypothetical protein